MGCLVDDVLVQIVRKVVLQFPLSWLYTVEERDVLDQVLDGRALVIISHYYQQTSLVFSNYIKYRMFDLVVVHHLCPHIHVLYVA